MDEAPYRGYRTPVLPEWIDHNEHLNAGYYGVAFDLATDAWLKYVGLTVAHRREHEVTTFTVETHTCFLREIAEGEVLHFSTTLLAHDEKRLHYIHEMFPADESYLAATNEVVTFHVSEATRRSAPMHVSVLERLGALSELHRRLERPAQVGRVMGLSRRG